ncbi:MAG: sulfurtransferase TusA family protein [Euzebya sp.]
MNESTQEVAEVDSRGRPCPVPVIDLARALAGVEVGQDVVVLADDPGAAIDIPAWCRMRKQELLDVTHEVTDAQEHTRYTVRRLT